MVGDGGPALVERLRRREPAAFEEAYDAYRHRVFNFLARLSRHKDVAAELADEVWLRLVANADRLRPDTELGPWLFTVARNLYFSYCRSRQFADAAMPDLLSLFPRISAAPSPERVAAGHEAVKNLEDALARLSAADREALLLVGVEEMNPQTAAAVCGVSGEVFRQRLSRARARLAALVNREDS